MDPASGARSAAKCKLSPISLLPIEVWELILNKITDPKDLYSVMNASPEWRELLWKRKGELFPLVLQTPRFMIQLPLATLLTCREITHQSKVIVDSSLQQHSSANRAVYFQNSNKVFQNMCNELTEKCYSFDSDESCSRFLAKMGRLETSASSSIPSSLNNPFILGCVQVSLLSLKRFSPFCAQLVKLFQIYGEHVFSLQVDFGRGFTANAGVLLTILDCVPNLRHLKVSTAPHFFISWPFHYEEIYEWIQRCQLPNLISLNVAQCKTLIGLDDKEYWDDWEFWEKKPKTVEGALFNRFHKQLVEYST